MPAPAPDNKIQEGDINEVPIQIEARVGPALLNFAAKPAQVALVVRLAVQEFIAAKIITEEFPGISLVEVQERASQRQKSAAGSEKVE